MKAVLGAVEIGAAVGLAAFTGGTSLIALAALPGFESSLIVGLAIGGIASEAGAIADALAANRGANITVRQPASQGQVIYGMSRVGGVLIRASTTGSKKDQYNSLIAIACHSVYAFCNLYADGRQVHWSGSGGSGTQAPANILFGGNADGNNYYDAGNNKYNFGGLLFCSFYRGTDAPGFVDPFYAANDPSFAADANGSPYGGPNLSYCYIKNEYDGAMFPQPPEYRFTVMGKNDIWDPRTNTYGYSCNSALIAADVLMNTEWGVGIPQALINEEQLIAAANLCDEQVSLANNLTEARYTFNGHFDTSVSPLDMINSVLESCGGSLTFSGGQYYIWPATAYSATAAFTDDDLIDGIQASAYRSATDLYNQVGGTFVCPTYPYSVTGNYYDKNGFDSSGYTQNNFNLAWQTTSFPTYAQDTLHGYPSDQWLTQDNGVVRRTSITCAGVISLATSQRLAKITLLRNRLQPGTYTFKMKMTAFNLAVMDVFTLSYPSLGWTNKQFQVSQWALSVEYEDGKPTGLSVIINATDYDQNCYAWSATEELDIYDEVITGYTGSNSYTVEPPSELTVSSGPAYDIKNVDGVVIPRVFSSWLEPQDITVTEVELQWAPTGTNAWITAGTVPVINLSTYFLGPIAGQTIDVQIRSLRSNGAGSVWVQAIGLLVSTSAISSLTSLAVAPGIPYALSNNATIDSIQINPTDLQAQLRVYGPSGPGSSWSLVTGAGTFTVPAIQTYVAYSYSAYACLQYPAGANLSQVNSTDLIVYANFNETVGDNIILIGTFTSIASSGSGGSSGGGGTGGNGGGGPRGAACTAMGTMLDTPDGPVSNVILKNRLDLGEIVYLTNGNGDAERLVMANWEWQTRAQDLTIGDVQIRCSDTHTVAVSGVHTHCSKVTTGSLIDTRTGPKVMKRVPVVVDVPVLKVTMSGPTHVYSVGGVLTHNLEKTN